MIKFLRQGTIENPWVFRVIILLIATAFVITMGWWGFDDDAAAVVAQIDDHRITAEEYQRAYRNYERFYRDTFKEQFTPELIKQLDLKHTVINTLIERQLWLKTARHMHLSVTARELADTIASFQAFQREETGRFDLDLYHRVLAANRTTPEAFETEQREDLLIAKVKTLIAESTGVTAPDWDEARARQAAQNPGPTSDATLPSPLPQKQERTLHAYMDHLRQRADIEVHEGML